MLVLLRDRQSKLLYAGHSRWTSNPAVAVDFRTVEEALLANRQEHLKDTEIVLQHSRPGSSVILPVGKRPWRDERWSFF